MPKLKLVPIASLSPAEAALAITEAYMADGTPLDIPAGLAIALSEPWPTDSQGHPAFLIRTVHGLVFIDMAQLRPLQVANAPLPQIYLDLPPGGRSARLTWEREVAEVLARGGRYRALPTLEVPAWVTAPSAKPTDPTPPAKPPPLELSESRTFPREFDEEVATRAREMARTGPLPHNTDLARAVLKAIGWPPKRVEANAARAAVRVGEILHVIGLRLRRSQRKRRKP